MKSTVVGYPYIGENREWKRTLEKFWRGELDEVAFEQQLQQYRKAYVERQFARGVDQIVVGDFTPYDRMLDLAICFGMVPKRFQDEKATKWQTYYHMARGAEGQVASEMTKWFNTNYHYIVPEYEQQKLAVTTPFIVEYYKEIKENSDKSILPTIIGPYTFITLTKGYTKETKRAFTDAIITCYVDVLQTLSAEGAEWVQLEEPQLVTTLQSDELEEVEYIYQQLQQYQLPDIKIQTYFEALTAYERLIQLPVAGFGLDFVDGLTGNLQALQTYGFPQDKVLSAGVISGRAIWKTDLQEQQILITTIQQHAEGALHWLQPSCHLQHVPVSVQQEQNLPTILKSALAFADEKLAELVSLVTYDTTVLAKSHQVVSAFREHSDRLNTQVQQAVQAIKNTDFTRDLSVAERLALQQAALQLPLLPTTTIGSFPQSLEVKKTRKLWRNHTITNEAYQDFIEQETARWIKIQEELDLDVLVHGEFERTDMVEYFGEQLQGFAFTQNGWVVSYGSRCVKPPIIYGDIAFSQPMTVKETAYAQSLTARPVKGMLTGPVTIINWSFVRDDISLKDVAYQLALALREEVLALEQAGIAIIQVDEPALREGLPLKEADQQAYIDWGVQAFKLTTSAVQESTQIHTHMCYCDFHDFMSTISALDADVISLETSRSHGELIQHLTKESYDKGIGLGVYDIHSPRVPAIDEMVAIIQDSLAIIPKERFWVNPDCGLKTRGEQETVASLHHLVAATKQMRNKIES